MAKKSTQQEPEAKDTISFSIRLTEQQRDLLEKAATTKGWTITNLIKNAALEKAAFILNTTAPNRVDFRRMARIVASEIFEPREVNAFSGEERIPLRLVESLYELPGDHQDDEPVAEVSPWHMPPSFLAELREAARYGGTEFLNLVLEASEGVAAGEKPKDLPNPIDPTAV